MYELLSFSDNTVINILNCPAMQRTVLPTESFLLPVSTDLYIFSMNSGTCWSRDPASLPRPHDFGFSGLNRESVDGKEYELQEKLHATSHAIIPSRILYAELFNSLIY